MYDMECMRTGSTEVTERVFVLLLDHYSAAGQIETKDIARCRS